MLPVELPVRHGQTAAREPRHASEHHHAVHPQASPDKPHPHLALCSHAAVHQRMRQRRRSRRRGRCGRRRKRHRRNRRRGRGGGGIYTPCRDACSLQREPHVRFRRRHHRGSSSGSGGGGSGGGGGGREARDQGGDAGDEAGSSAPCAGPGSSGGGGGGSRRGVGAPGEMPRETRAAHRCLSRLGHERNGSGSPHRWRADQRSRRPAATTHVAGAELSLFAQTSCDGAERTWRASTAREHGGHLKVLERPRRHFQAVSPPRCTGRGRGCRNEWHDPSRLFA
mmetsp:Transcript_6149/g.15255  ORF Transcript_6149/g.15255 Transcript_6149/m.15255 type:complete len:281 (-) Transcript_6149:88-930(-)